MHPSTAGGERRRVLMVFPFDMSVRTFASSPLVAALASDARLDLLFISREERDRDLLRKMSSRSVEWCAILRPFQQSFRPGVGFLRRCALFLADVRVALGHYWFLSLVYRFNALHGFKGFSDRIRQ